MSVDDIMWWLGEELEERLEEARWLLDVYLEKNPDRREDAADHGFMPYRKGNKLRPAKIDNTPISIDTIQKAMDSVKEVGKMSISGLDAASYKSWRDHPEYLRGVDEVRRVEERHKTNAAIQAHMNEHKKYLQASKEDRADAEIRRELKVVQENHRLMGINRLSVKDMKDIFPPVEEVAKAYEDAMLHGESFLKTAWNACQHEAVDNGMRRSWCKTCDADLILGTSGLWTEE